MKTISSILLLLSIAMPALAEVKVVATISALGDIVRQVGGDRVEVVSLVDGRRDIHSVEILPSYMLKVKRAKLFVQAGLDLELWARDVVEGARNRNLHIVDCSNGIEILERPAGPVNPGMGDIHVAGNPHYWLHPRNGVIIARTVADGLIAVDGDGAAEYEANFTAFETAVNARMTEWSSRFEALQGVELIYFHNSWPYFNHAFGLVAAGFVEPKPGVSPSPHHTAEIMNLIRAKGIRVIAMAPYFDDRVPQSIARETGAKVVVLAGSVGGVDGANDYLSMFEVNLRALEQALR